MTTAYWYEGKGIHDEKTGIILLSASRKSRRFHRQMALAMWERTTPGEAYKPTDQSPKWYAWKPIPDWTEPNHVINVIVLVGLDHEILEVYWGTDESKARRYFTNQGWKRFGRFWRK